MIGIIGAMDVEIEGIVAKMTEITTTNAAGMAFHQGSLAGRRVVVAKCRVGKVNAAMCAQAMVDKFAVAAVINLGVAGAVYDGLNIGDVVVSKNLAQHDFDVTFADRPPGFIPELGVYFVADEKLATAAFDACHEVFLGSGNRAHMGTIATGDQFIADRAAKDRIWEHFEAYCVEMEGAAIAQVCQLNNIPFVVIRAISDKADGSAHADFSEFVAMAADNSAKIVTRLVGVY
ncbi:MAG: 5'-methylthioadenosine/adenosylhomocysteine nucleosidase [Defluviitaleaceae bacterium]|nr:5'-methylthioadenosine/adenosylhomocysteine nucleosidase [Defluviitaleaceae bacterium]